MIGDLQGPLAVVDEGGQVQVIGRGWSFEWGVGVGDRWFVAQSMSTLRRQRIDDAPVYETRLRMSGGNIFQRVAVANHGVSRSLVVEFENASSDAVAVALVGHAHNKKNNTKLAASRDGVRLGGQLWIRAERQAGGVVAVADAAATDVWLAVQHNPGTEVVSVSGEQLAAGLVVPLPHHQKVKFQIAVEGEVPTRLVTPAEVAAGWRAVTADALSIDVADSELGVAWRRILVDLIVQAGSDDLRVAGEAAPFLDIAGLDREADRARAALIAASEQGLLSDAEAVVALRALASRELRIGKDSGLRQLVDVLVMAASRSLDAQTVNLVAWALAAKAPRTAEDVRGLVDALNPNSRYQCVSPAAVAATDVLKTVLCESQCKRIDLLPKMPPDWFGRPADVRGFATLWGRISFSLRWHGRKPALLWERTGSDDTVELRCSAIDPSWSTFERQGEALLGCV